MTLPQGILRNKLDPVLFLPYIVIQTLCPYFITLEDPSTLQIRIRRHRSQEGCHYVLETSVFNISWTIWVIQLPTPSQGTNLRSDFPQSQSSVTFSRPGFYCSPFYYHPQISSFLIKNSSVIKPFKFCSVHLKEYLYFCQFFT